MRAHNPSRMREIEEEGCGRSLPQFKTVKSLRAEGISADRAGREPSKNVKYS